MADIKYNELCHLKIRLIQNRMNMDSLSSTLKFTRDIPVYWEEEYVDADTWHYQGLMYEKNAITILKNVNERFIDTAIWYALINRMGHGNLNIVFQDHEQQMKRVGCCGEFPWYKDGIAIPLNKLAGDEMFTLPEFNKRAKALISQVDRAFELQTGTPHEHFRPRQTARTLRDHIIPNYIYEPLISPFET